jgi:hypothetical protein
MLPAGVALLFFSAIKFRKYPQKLRREAIACCCILGQVAFWFFMAPDLRFGGVFFHILFAWSLALSFSGFKMFRFWSLSWGRITGLVLLNIFLAGKVAERLPRRLQISIRRSESGRVIAHRIENGQFPPLIVYVPAHGDQTGDSELPATPYPLKQLHARQAGFIQKGVRVHPE